MTRIPRFGGTTWLAAAVALLLPALAWMQYDWVNQLATADRERRERTLRAAGAQFTAAVDAEVSRLGGSLQLDSAMLERRDWEAYGLRYDSAVDDGAGALVAGVWFVEVDDAAATPDARLRLHAWRPDERTFEPTAWPEALAGVRAQLIAEPARRGPGGRMNPREIFAAAGALGDERTLVMPILRVQMPREAGSRRDRFTTDVQMRGFTIVRLDLETMARVRLPALAGEHFPESSEYHVAVVTSRGGETLFESAPGAAAGTAQTADLVTTFIQARVGPMMVFARTSPDGRIESRTETLPPPPPPPPGGGEIADGGDRAVVSVIEMRDRDGQRTVRARALGHAHGHWTLRVKHAAGSLEAAVAASRRRNLALSGGVLALLGVVVALISVSARRAQALARRQMEFVAAVSHELRTPVAVINSAAGNLADGVVGDPARVKRYGATIQTEARRLGDTVERVLQLAGLGSGRPLPMAPVAPGAFVHEAVRLTAADAAEAGVRVHVELPDDLPAVLGDAGTLQSAVQNLVGNAIKYAGPDRWVRVAVTTHDTPRREVRIAVEDHGQGLDPEEQRLVFEPFFRGKAAVANQIKGSGLGLSLVRRISDAHGGRVDVVSAPGHGSTFTICLPAAPDAPAAASVPAASAHAAATEA
jgi:two-component system, OmpR family, sensor histidine kinase SenX3